MRKVILLIIIVVVIGSFISSDQSSKSYIITTATPGGTYYPVGVAIGALITLKLHKSHDITAMAITSAGSGENIHMLHNKEADFAILQALFGALASRGEGNYQGQPVSDFRAITVLWENVEHFVLLTRFAETGNIQDLKDLGGRKFSIGKRGSGTEGSGRVILGALGVDVNEDIRLEFVFDQVVLNHFLVKILIEVDDRLVLNASEKGIQDDECHFAQCFGVLVSVNAPFKVDLSDNIQTPIFTDIENQTGFNPIADRKRDFFKHLAKARILS